MADQSENFQACFSCPILANKQYPRTQNTNSSISKSTFINKLRSFSSCFYFLGSYKQYKIWKSCVRHDPRKCVVLVVEPTGNLQIMETQLTNPFMGKHNCKSTCFVQTYSANVQTIYNMYIHYLKLGKKSFRPIPAALI